MPIQAFVDDSGGKGATAHFVLAGLAGHSDSWAHFSEEWRLCLSESPAITAFKMREAASCTGQFRYMTDDQRDKKLRALGRIINRHARLVTCTVIDLSAHAETWALLDKPRNDPYFWPFHNTIAAICFSLWDYGWREPFEITFDEDVIFGPRAKLWYPVVREVLKYREPEASTILPVDPRFRSDDESLPIQAADLFAWVIRKKHDDPTYDRFDWLFNEELMAVQMSEYVQYYDKQRMSDVTAESHRLAREGAVPTEVIQAYQRIYAND
ncbi:hypothetical protein AUC68_03570 [Methyloceanibacter methanicus]|uniref:DUF3800 domain-containing protein n=1 Tax=Methyloceanibacter methanicus TaxID=1774968 RepID=A0A1E3W320_9HYPH|nr:DUF3800 domain-containing protein [Methyloceanibacter methanicus]ODS00193.1 hypothetical protein AUC68_03570 [Methyloceanibacter methanicus]